MSQETITGIKREQTVKEKTDTLCYHCGSEFEEVVIQAYQHQFCCSGCKTVYEILDENGLHNYYGLEQNPGTKASRKQANKFAFLDNEDVINGLLDFSDGGMSSVKFFVSQIHCSSCIWLLENLHRLSPGVIKSTVHFLKKEVYIVFKDSDISLRELVELMSSIGYEPNISLDDYKKEEVKDQSKSFFYKLGVAGFAFGNIMLLSFPEYFDANEYLEEGFKKLFGYLNLFLATPVFIYSASGYFVSAVKALKKKYLNIDFPISVGIIALYFRSAFEIITQTGPGFMDSFTMFVFLLLVGKWYQNRTYQALSFERDYKSYFPLAVVKIFKDKEEPVPVGDLEIGDNILLRNQEIIPADSVLGSENAQIDYSFVTGESLPIDKQKGDKLFAGGRLVGASIRVKISKAVSQSYLTRLWNQDTFLKEGSRVQSIVDKVSQYFTVTVLIVSAITLAFWWGEGATIASKVFTSVLIIACPCALALTLPFAYGNTMTVFGRNRFYQKNAEAVEQMAKVDTIVFDKTGTLTQSGDESIEFVGEALSSADLLRVKSLAGNSTHPLSKSIYKHIEESKVNTVLDFKEVPAKGIQAEVNGIMIQLGSQDFVGNEMASKKDLSSRVFVKIKGEHKGYFLIKKHYRPGISKLIDKLRAKEYDLHLISGDNSAEMKNLQKYFSPSNLHFDQSPEDKMKYIQDLQSNQAHVLMVGDGLNDAGALKQANVGLAVSDDVYNFTPACDAILDAGMFTKLDEFMAFSKQTMQVVRISFGISLFYNSLGMFFAVQGLVTPLFAAILMPISSITVVGFITLVIRLSARRKGL